MSDQFLEQRINFKFLSQIIGGDEIWCFPCHSESKRQSLQWKQQTFPQSKRARLSKSQMKTMLNTFFDIKGIVHFEFITQSQTVKAMTSSRA
jgi:hypothetical protein